MEKINKKIVRHHTKTGIVIKNDCQKLNKLKLVTLMNKIVTLIKKRVKQVEGKVKKQFELIKYKGNKYNCPFCNYSSKKMALLGLEFPVIKEKSIIGAGVRQGLCRKCGSTDRERLVYIYLKDQLQIFSNKDKSILHIAPEWNLSKKIDKFGFKNYICGDLQPENYPNYVQKINILDIPYGENTFDLIICNHVLEHIPNDFDAMEELYRVLKMGGQAILQVPISKNLLQTFEDFSVIDPQEREIVFGQCDHVRIYGQDYADRLTFCKFKVKRKNIYKEYPKFGFNEEEDIFVIEK